MANIFSLFGSIFIDNEKANKSIDDTTNKAKSSSSSFKESLGNIAKTGAKIATTVVTATAAAGTAIMGMANKTAANCDEIDKMSQRLGMSREAYQEWDYVLSQAGVDINSIQTGMKSLVKNMDAVTEGNKNATENFNKLGISVYDTEGKLKSQEIMFEETVIALQNMEDGTEKARLAQELFGKQGQEMLPLLNGESGSVEELMKKAHELGMVLSDETIDAGVNFTDTMDTLKKSATGLFNVLGGVVMPIVEKVLNAIINNIPNIQDIICQFSPIIMDLASQVFPPLMELAELILPVIINLLTMIIPICIEIIQSIMPVIINLLQMILPPVLQIVEKLLPLLLKLIEPILPLLDPILELLQPLIDLLVMILDPLIELLDLILPPIITLLSMILQMILPALQNYLTIVSNVLSSVFCGAFNLVKEQISNLINVFKNIIDFVKNVFTGDWESAWQNIKNIFSGIAAGLGNTFKAPINFIIDLINGFISGLNKIKIPDWVPGIGGAGFYIEQIRKLRVGMEYVPYDDMPALLHKGEAVLTADENKRYQENKNNVVVERPGYTKEELVEAFTEAIKNLKANVVLNDEKLGDFIMEKIEGEIYG